MAKYKVKQGKCISSIADEHGFFWETIWKDSQNAELKQKRKNPNVLFPGDEVFIPDKREKTESGITEKQHCFRAKGRIRYLRLIVQNPEGNPLVEKQYMLDIDGRTVENPAGAPLATDADGMIEACIPANATEGRLVIDGDTWVLGLSYLDPIETTEGLQARLNNLNYPLGPVDGIEGPRTREAIRNFQRDNDLMIDGVYGPKTQDKLRQVHGC